MPGGTKRREYDLIALANAWLSDDHSDEVSEDSDGTEREMSGV